MTESEVKFGVDLSKLVDQDDGPEMLGKLSETKGLPERLRFDAAMLGMLIEDGYSSDEEGDLSQYWTVETSPRTKARVATIIGREI